MGALCSGESRMRKVSRESAGSIAALLIMMTAHARQRRYGVARCHAPP